MLEFLTSIWMLAIIFFVVALIYSSVGLGGGSSYTAFLVIFGFSTLTIPLISLTLNILVTSIGSYNFIRNKHARIRLIAPFLLSSIPMAYLGGVLQVPKLVFQWILFVSLMFVVFRIYLWRKTVFQLKVGAAGKLAISVIAGSILGLLAGIVGIGGGIYLVPLILLLGLGTVKEAAACGAIFIWLNSSAGLLSRLQYNTVDLQPYVPLIIAVIIGGTIGSFMGAFKLPADKVEQILGVVIIVAMLFLGRTLLFS